MKELFALIAMGAAFATGGYVLLEDALRAQADLSRVLRSFGL